MTTPRLVAQLSNGVRVFVVPTGLRFDCNITVSPDGKMFCRTHPHLTHCGGPTRLERYLKERPQQPPPPLPAA